MSSSSLIYTWKPFECHHAKQFFKSSRMTLSSSWAVSDKRTALSFAVFGGLNDLRHLNASFNKIHQTHEKVFQTTRKLHWLNIEGNQLDTFNERWIYNFECLDTCYSDFFQICCSASALVQCYPAPINTSTCLRIFHTNFHALLIYTILLPSLFVFLAKRVTSRGNILYSMHNYLVDELTTIHLYLVFTADGYYGKAYIIMFDIMWCTTIFCSYIPTISFFLHVWFYLVLSMPDAAKVLCSPSIFALNGTH